MRGNTTLKIARKTSTQTINNSATQTALTQLLLALGANEIWYFKLVLLLDGKAVADADVSLTGPSGSTLTYGDIALGAKDAVGADEINFPLVDDLKTVCTVEGVISTGSTAGNLQALAAQATANASDLDILPGSHIEAHRIDDTV